MSGPQGYTGKKCGAPDRRSDRAEVRHAEGAWRKGPGQTVSGRRDAEGQVFACAQVGMCIEVHGEWIGSYMMCDMDSTLSTVILLVV